MAENTAAEDLAFLNTPLFTNIILPRSTYITAFRTVFLPTWQFSEGADNRRFDYLHSSQVPSDNNPILAVELICVMVEYQDPRFVRHGLDPGDDLLMVFVPDVGPVHLDDAIALSQAPCQGW